MKMAAIKTYEAKQTTVCDCGHDYAKHEKSLLSERKAINLKIRILRARLLKDGLCNGEALVDRTRAALEVRLGQ